MKVAKCAASRSFLEKGLDCERSAKSDSSLGKERELSTVFKSRRLLIIFESHPGDRLRSRNATRQVVTLG